MIGGSGPHATTRGPRPRTLARATAVLCGAIVLPAALELGLRLARFEFPPLEAPVVFWNPRNDVAMRAGTDLHEIDLAGLWRPRAGAEIPGADGERVNDLGLRGPLPSDPRHAGVLRVATLGDSSTFGLETPFAQSYSGRLPGLLADLGQIEVLAAGVVGYTAVQGRVRFRELCAPLEPDATVIAFGAVNEHFPSDVGGDAERIAIHARRAGAPYRARMWLLEHTRAAQAWSWLIEGGAEGRRAAIAAWASSQEHQVEVWERRGAVGLDGSRRVEPEEFGAVLATLVEAVRDAGSEPVLVAPPRRVGIERELPVLLEYDRALREYAAESGVTFVDVYAAFRERDADAELFIDGVHPSPEGHELYARLLEPVLRDVLSSRRSDS